MKMMTKIVSILVLLLLASPVLLLQGCGSDVADKQGCPSGSYLANSTDVLLIPDDASFSIPFAVGGAPASSALYALNFVVTDKDNTPRNNVCVRLSTGGGYLTNTWYTDQTYSTEAVGSGPLNTLTIVTDNSGAAVLYWVTWTPPGNPATGTTAGADITGTSWIGFTSGALSKTWITTWTVVGEPAP